MIYIKKFKDDRHISSPAESNYGERNAHARRKFERQTDYPADRKKWIDWFWELYDFESEAKGQRLVGGELLAHLQRYQRPVWDQVKAELDSIDDRVEQVVLPKSDFRKALNYVHNHWSELTRYLDDADLPLDNNECEQLMRTVALGFHPETTVH